MRSGLAAISVFALLLGAASTAYGEDELDRWGVGLQPIIGYDDESSLTLGTNSVLYFNPDPSNKEQELDELDLVTTYSFRGGYNANADVTKNFGTKERSLEVVAGYEKSVEDYYGVGLGGPVYEGVTYSSIDIPFSVAYSFQVYENLYLCPKYDFHSQEVREIETESGPPPPELVELGTTRASGIGLSTTYKTTNPGLYKRRGFAVTASSIYYSPRLLGSSAFELSGLSYRQYFPVATEMVLGFHLRFETASGDVPLYCMPGVGGHRLLRGVKNNRYTGNHALAGQTEFRFPIWWRFGGTVFVGAGEATKGMDGFGRNIQVAGGIGLRFMVQTRQKINIRLDLAYNSDSDIRKYVKIKEAF
jgi:Omp85 superfamily domain